MIFNYKVKSSSHVFPYEVMREQQFNLQLIESILQFIISGIYVYVVHSHTQATYTLRKLENVQNILESRLKAKLGELILDIRTFRVKKTFNKILENLKALTVLFIQPTHLVSRFLAL